MAKPKSTAKSALRPVKLIPPGSQEAREEGPRSVPLNGHAEESRVQHYLELADVALHNNGNHQESKPARPNQAQGAVRRR